MDKTIVLKPRMSEKSYRLSQVANTYVFDVSGDVNKHNVARAVAAQFDVTVADVNITNVKGKPARVIAKGGRRVSRGHRSDYKKAYVTLAKGNKLPFFEAIEEEEAKVAETQEKLDKVAAKAAEKEAKKAAKEKK
jgi:large subunit ribosomal protein L23